MGMYCLLRFRKVVNGYPSYKNSYASNDRSSISYRLKEPWLISKISNNNPGRLTNPLSGRDESRFPRHNFSVRYKACTVSVDSRSRSRILFLTLALPLRKTPRSQSSISKDKTSSGFAARPGKSRSSRSMPVRKASRRTTFVRCVGRMPCWTCFRLSPVLASRRLRLFCK